MNGRLILICGGSGMIGKTLSEKLSLFGYKPRILTRTKQTTSTFEQFYWDPDHEIIEPGALENLYGVINLTGASIGSKRWSESRKREIFNSRICSTRFIINQINALSAPPLVFLSASAIGIYGDCQEGPVDEMTSIESTDFLSDLCLQWEGELLKLNKNIRQVILRIGLTLSMKDGLLAKSILPAKLGLAPFFGSGRQIYSWIHIEDLINLFCWLLKNEARGVYNAVTNHPVSQAVFSKSLAKTFHRLYFSFHIPKWFLRLIIGEFSHALFTSQFILPMRLNTQGYRLKYEDLNEALNNLII